MNSIHRLLSNSPPILLHLEPRRDALSGPFGDGVGVRGRRRTSELALAAAILLLQITPSVAANANMVAEFGRTCVASKSSTDLKNALARDSWKLFSSLAQTHLQREIKGVTPMLDAQGLSSDYVIYGRDVGGKHFELALSETKKPVIEGRRLVGCSMYDFDATSPIDSALISAFAPKIAVQKNSLSDAQIEIWVNAFGDGTGMRAVFIPASSPMGDQLGFTGMMLGTHFLDRAK